VVVAARVLGCPKSPAPERREAQVGNPLGIMFFGSMGFISSLSQLAWD
jgi:hypothetical protein